MTIRRIAKSALAVFVLAAGGCAFAQDYPTQPIRLIVPFAPGGAVDQTARTIGNALGERLGQTIIIENKPGASGSLGAIELHKAKPDGYTLMLALDSQAVNHYIVKNLPFDTVKDFSYLSLLVTTPQVLVIRNDIKAKNLDEFVAYLKNHPESSYGSVGTASAGHINSAQLSIKKGLKTQHIPYKGAAPLLSDLLGAHIDYAFAGLSVMLPFIKEGKIRAIAVSSPQRSSQLPDVPAMKESIPDFDFPTWIGLLGPKNLPPDVRAKILAATHDVMHDPKIVDRFNKNAFDVVNSSPEEFLARIKKDSSDMAELIKEKVIVPE